MEKEAYGEAWGAIEKNFLNLKGVYLDHAGSTLYGQSQMETAFLQLSTNTFGNPHSRSPSSVLTSDLIDQVRAEVLQFFKADPEEYSLIFTSGATHSLKIVAESFLFSNTRSVKQNDMELLSLTSSPSFAYLKESHTSVVGMREVIKAFDIPCFALPSDYLQEDQTLISDCAVDQNCNREINKEAISKQASSSNSCNSLFAFPAQCNFSGVKYPLEWISASQDGKLSSRLKSEFCVNYENVENVGDSDWYCLLDAASYVSTNPLDLSRWHPDFVAISFYKMIGFPTGLGALIVRSRAFRTLTKRYFGGGTVEMFSSSRNFHVVRNSFHERFEDGTSNFLAIVSLGSGLRELKKLVLSMKNISTHTYNLAGYLHKSFRELEYANGKSVIELYPSEFRDQKRRGGIVTFNVKDENGGYIGYAQVEKNLALHEIHVRTGCFCNPAACQRYLHLSDDDIYNQFMAGHKCGDENDLINGRPTGAVRVSFGYMSKRSDADILVKVLRMCFLSDKVTTSTAPIKNELAPLEKRNMSNAKLSGIHIYPIKSCGAFSPKIWPVSKAGLLYDRQWVIVNAVGAALTQKREPKLCLIRPDINLIKKVLTLRYHDNEESVSIPLNEGCLLTNDDPQLLAFTKICGSKLVQAIDCGPLVGKWLSEVLDQQNLKLVRYSETSSSLANDSPFLLVNRKSAISLEQQCKSITAEMNSEMDFLSRFRGNLVIDGIEPFEEDKFEVIEIGHATFRNVGPCYRCQMICVDQGTAGRNHEALKALSNIRGKKLPFGIHMELSSIEDQEITIQVDSMLKMCLKMSENSK